MLVTTCTDRVTSADWVRNCGFLTGFRDRTCLHFLREVKEVMKEIAWTFKNMSAKSLDTSFIEIGICVPPP